MRVDRPGWRRGAHGDGTVIGGLVAVGTGAALGAWLRWGLSAWLNPVFPTVPLGTLAANLVGGFLMGIAMEVATRHAVLSPDARLFVTTGFLGGLTTFSTFSAEAVTLMLRREWLWGSVHLAGHLAGSVVLTIAGLLAARAIFAGGA